MPSILRRSWPFRKRPDGEPDRAFRRGRAWFLLSYAAPVIVTATGILAIGGALADSDRGSRWFDFGLGVALASAGLYWWWRHHQPIYEFFGTELWKGKRFLVDLADVKVARISSHRYRAPGSPLIGVFVVVHLVGRPGAGSTRLLGVHRLAFDEQRNLHALLQSNGVRIEGRWLLGNTGEVIDS